MGRVLVIAGDTVIGRAIEAFLLKEADLEVKLVAPSDQDAIQAVIDQFQPEVIVIEEGVNGIPSVEGACRTFSYGSSRLIQIPYEKNYIEVSEKYRIPYAGLAQLVSAIKADK